MKNRRRKRRKKEKKVGENNGQLHFVPGVLSSIVTIYHGLLLCACTESEEEKKIIYFKQVIFVNIINIDNCIVFSKIRKG